MDTIKDLIKFCEEKSYTIICSSLDEIVVKTERDTWKISRVDNKNCKMMHLNKNGKSQFHCQGRTYYPVKYIKRCMEFHNSYKN